MYICIKHVHYIFLHVHTLYNTYIDLMMCCLKHVQSMACNVCACVQLEGVVRDGVLVRRAMLTV